MNTKVIYIIAIGIILVLVYGFIHKKFSDNGNGARTDPGFLVINTDKYLYTPGEEVYVQITSLDGKGKTNCTSNLTLSVNYNGGLTDKPSINLSPTCSNSNAQANNPDYYTYFKPSKEGNYKIVVLNEDNEDSAETEIVVATNTLDLSVTRWSATKINANGINRYPMVITVKANNNFSGVITDSIPSDFDFAWYGSATLTTGGSDKLTTGGSDKLTTGGSDEKRNIISWNVDLKEGETKELKYEYIPQKGGKNSYLIGPVKITSGISSVDAGNTWVVTLQSL